MKDKPFNSRFFLISLMFAIFIPGCGIQQEATPLVATQPFAQTTLPASNFGVGDIASIARQDVVNSSNEEIVKLLVGQWLEGYKADMTNKDAIKNYSIEEVFINNQPNGSNSEIITTVTFSVQLVKYSDNWVSMATKDHDENDPSWWHLGATFNIVPDDEHFRLRILFGYGT